jgi:hypothetical protein
MRGIYVARPKNAVFSPETKAFFVAFMILISTEVEMVLQTRAGSRLLIYSQTFMVAGQGLSALMSIGAHRRPMKRVVRHARDHVPLCGYLQIPVRKFARYIGNPLWMIKLSGGRNGIPHYDFYRTAALGE